MEVSSPIEPVYYYECSAGRFRLTYFIPPEEMDRLITAGRLHAHARDDFPDGVDLDCTLPDFVEFEDSYGYRPEADPEALQAAFFAIFSSTPSVIKIVETYCSVKDGFSSVEPICSRDSVVETPK